MDSAKRPISCCPFTPATILPALPDDINYKRCRCPKWINGILGIGWSVYPSQRENPQLGKGRRVQAQSWKTEYEAKQNGWPGSKCRSLRSENTSVKDAVSRFLSSKRNENLADSTLDKLTTIFEKQFLGMGYMLPRFETSG